MSLTGLIGEEGMSLQEALARARHLSMKYEDGSLTPEEDYEYKRFYPGYWRDSLEIVERKKAEAALANLISEATSSNDLSVKLLAEILKRLLAAA